MAGLWLSHHIGNFSIPTDELLIFFGGVGMPPTRYSSWGFWFFRDLLEAYLAPAFSILHPTQPFYRATVTKTPPALCGFRDGPVYIYNSNPQKDQKDRTVMYHDVSLFVFFYFTSWYITYITAEDRKWILLFDFLAVTGILPECHQQPQAHCWCAAIQMTLCDSMTRLDSIQNKNGIMGLFDNWWYPLVMTN